MKKIIALLVCFSIIFGGCGVSAGTQDLTENITPQNVAIVYDDNIYTYLTDFSAGLFSRSAKEDENTLISPVSMLYLLAMIQNGAGNNTLRQLQSATGVDTDSLNCFMAEFSSNGGKEIHTANGIWVREGFEADRNFLQTNADYFGAGIYSTPFDSNTVKHINSFVKENTDGMIDSIIDRLDRETVVCLINALTFKDKWAVQYEKSSIVDNTFTNNDGSTDTVPFMHSEEGIYFQNEGVTGFSKPYKGGNYSFVALLPPENADINRFVNSFTGEKLKTILNNPTYCHVNAFIPEFESRYGGSMIDPLKSMGITDLFEPDIANLSAMGNSDTGLYISKMLHKTYISVNPEGTKAAAISFATADECRSAEPAMSYTVRLDRPFVYMIIHNETNLPIFMGNIAKIR